MSGFLFWFVFVFNLLFIIVGVWLYICDRLRNNKKTTETPIFGLKASTFYIISIISLVILSCLYDNPVSSAWKNQHNLDSSQNKIIDSLKIENSLLKTNMKDIRSMIELNNQLDEKIINSMGKRDVIVINNYQKRHHKHHCRYDSVACDSARLCGKCKYPIFPHRKNK